MKPSLSKLYKRNCFLWHNKGEHKFAKTCVKKCRYACTVYSMFKWRLPMGGTQKLCALKLICTFLLMAWVIQLGNTHQLFTLWYMYSYHQVKKDYNTLIKIFKEMEFTGKFKLEAHGLSLCCSPFILFWGNFIQNLPQVPPTKFLFIWLIILNAACLAEKHQIPISNSQPTALEASMLTIAPLMRLKSL